MNFQKGEVLYFDKPYHWTSFGLVGRIRWTLCQKLGIPKLKVGHAGTLDPLATGVLIVCTGKRTKTIDQLQGQTKEYVATLKLGETTASYDMEHPVNATFPTEHITEDLMRETLKKFLGRIEQIPPEYSACKVDGKPAYIMARKGKEVKLKPKTLVIDEIELLDFHLPEAKIRVVCSKGTYIRALARDIGEALHSGAYLTALRRTRVGDIRVEDCLDPTHFEEWLNNQQIETEATDPQSSQGKKAGR